ncbi:hypothetical protein [Paludisphaera borealis]|nr:hypothetical protein [Paludisphaera borealis]
MFPWRATAVRGLGSVNLGLGALDLGLAAVYGVLRAGQFPSSEFNPQALFFSMLVEVGKCWRALELDPYLGDLAGQGTLMLFNHPPFYDAYMEAMLALHMGLAFLHLGLGAGLRRLDRRALRVQGALATVGIVFAWLTFPALGAAVASVPLAGVAALTWPPIREAADQPSKGVSRSLRAIVATWTLAVVLIPIALVLVEIGMIQTGIFVHHWYITIFNA